MDRFHTQVDLWDSQLFKKLARLMNDQRSWERRDACVATDNTCELSTTDAEPCIRANTTTAQLKQSAHGLGAACM